MAAQKNFEIECKYRISNPAAARKQIAKLKARLIHSGFEQNEFYDQKKSLLKRCYSLRLRLHPDGTGKLTLKGPRQKAAAAISKRIEIETPVHFRDTRKLLLGLGYAKVFAYRKKRATYRLGNCEITLDQVPGLGHFMEIEASSRQIKMLEKKLGLKPEQAEERSYLQMLLGNRFPKNI